MRNVSNPCNRSYKHRCFLPGGNNTSPSLMFLSLKLDNGGMNPQSCITLPLGVAIYYLAKVTSGNGEHERTLKNKNIKVNQIFYSSETQHNLIIHQIPASTA